MTRLGGLSEDLLRRAVPHRLVWCSVAVIAMTAVFGALGYRARIDTFNSTHWLFRYDFGFVKRGLVGTIYGMFSPEVAQAQLWWAQMALAVLAAVAYGVLVHRMVVPALRAPVADADEARRRLRVTLVLSAFLLSAPGVLRQYFHDLGRFDDIGFLAIVGTFAAVRRLSSWPALIVTTGLSAVAIAVHEAYYLWVAPIGLGLWYLENRAHPRAFAALVVAGMALTALTGVVAMHSYRDFLPQDRLKALLERRSDFRVEDNTVRVQYFTLRGNFLYSYERGARAFRLVFVVIGTMFLLPWIGLLRELAAEGVALGRWRRRVVGLLAAAPLALFPLGYDYGRWLAMLNVNLAVLILYLIGRDSRVIDRIGPRRIRVMLWMVALDLALGPYGISTPLH